MDYLQALQLIIICRRDYQKAEVQQNLPKSQRWSNGYIPRYAFCVSQCSFISIIALNLIFLFRQILRLLQLSDKGKNEKEEELKSNEAVEAMNAMKHAADLIVKMDENLKEEEDILHERAIRLRRQSADAFKLMDDVKKLQKYNPLISSNSQLQNIS